ncbi:uncharacterized protein LOC125477768 [Pyrus x bretschneideri]|uniref:uncharacterized protein LOC125477768 n=1 Tax=Pyrus x bretschneideri TaxID=225117 RepID=UPI002030E2A6|nr:uncharacterized protein LOC125477768 [Pyrus x bretschneideri]
MAISLECSVGFHHCPNVYRMFCKHEPTALLVKLEDVKAENMQKCLHPRKSAKKKVKLIRLHQGQIANTTASRANLRPRRPTENEGLGRNSEELQTSGCPRNAFWSQRAIPLL